MLRETYGRIAPFYDLLDLPFEHGRYRSMRPVVFERVADAERLLDCGVGTGRNIPYYPPRAKVVGIDLSIEMMARAIGRGRALGREVSWGQADITSLPCAESSFDAATATFLFCVLPDELQSAALRELARVVKPGGRIVLLEYVLSQNRLRRWTMRRLWGPWIRFAYGASFERPTHEASGVPGVHCGRAAIPPRRYGSPARCQKPVLPNRSPLKNCSSPCEDATVGSAVSAE